MACRSLAAEYFRTSRSEQEITRSFRAEERIVLGSLTLVVKGTHGMNSARREYTECIHRPR